MLKNLFLLIFSLVVTLALAELFVVKWILHPTALHALLQGADYDTRSRLEVVLDARRTDPYWFPAVPANTYLTSHIIINGERILPLAGVANAKVVGCNESGYFNTFATDELGFRNPKQTWPLTERSHVFLIGDSFTQGDCVNDGDDIAGLLRKKYPHLVNLGVGGNGPLFELATLREYVINTNALRPRVVWLYYEGNDLTDLARDMRDPILRRYLDPQYTQSLYMRRDAVNAAVRSHVEKKIAEGAKNLPWMFPYTRQLVWTLRHKNRAADPAQDKNALSLRSVEQFVHLIELAQTQTQARGGRFLFVYLPEYNRFIGKPPSMSARMKPELLSRLQAAGVEVLDLTERLVGHKDPASLLPFRMPGRHYTPEGYAIIADALANHLAYKFALKPIASDEIQDAKHAESNFELISPARFIALSLSS